MPRAGRNDHAVKLTDQAVNKAAREAVANGNRREWVPVGSLPDTRSPADLSA
jgi:hypothetical protein